MCMNWCRGVLAVTLPTQMAACSSARSVMKQFTRNGCAMPVIPCADCKCWIVSRNVRKVRCLKCQHKRIAQQKIDSAHRELPVRIDGDISDAEIELRFSAAMKEIRRQSSDSLEPFRSYDWLYREPRS